MKRQEWGKATKIAAYQFYYFYLPPHLQCTDDLKYMLKQYPAEYPMFEVYSGKATWSSFFCVQLNIFSSQNLDPS